MVPAKIANILKDINDLLIVNVSDNVSWVDILRWSVGESRTVNGAAVFKTYQDKTKAVFKTKMPPLTRFPFDWHDCNEICTVLSGSMVDEMTGTEWRAGESAVFPRRKAQSALNPSLVTDTVIEVTFEK